MSLRTREDYERALTLVRGVIAAWDPYTLLASGAPDDEFDAEAARIVAQIPRIKSDADAANAISSVFSAAFEPSLFTPQSVATVARELFARLQDAGFV